ncbi:hypothetical protein [Blautia sp. MSJ-19]|uniref:hypothetical protein n=1 Tax=Blautia sp. MSJ-19 TaxID=2841517 RepID=UPI001C0E9822|nr:hypothetical protein [Blautia sp. MSJ-19]MBU5481741.1 hypothetical protein [Blautia sp. MSJ-19]
MATIPKNITERYKMNGVSIYQPDKDMGYNFETTYSEGSNRTQFGKALLTPLFTVEQYSYEATDVPVKEANKIFKIVAKGEKFNLYHWSLYHMAWRTDPFYVGKGSLTFGEVSPDLKTISKLSFNMQGVNPLD